jgi:hypothetical protein
VKELSVAIPASVVSDTPHLREKTAKLGTIARASSIFGVHEIILYLDDPKQDQEADMKFCSEILRYIETPQYLRKRMFKLSPTLRFTGILPPLQAPHHNVPHTISEVNVGDVREGVVVSRSGQNMIVDAGLEETILTPGTYRAGERVTLRLISVGRKLRGELETSKTSISQGSETRPYWGYKVTRTLSLGKLLQERDFSLKIGTSRYGSQITEIWPSLKAGLKRAETVLVVFGSPKSGLREILQHEKLDPRYVFDYFVNTIPNQQTATVRTEEAIPVSLSILNIAQELPG